MFPLRYDEISTREDNLFYELGVGVKYLKYHPAAITPSIHFKFVNVNNVFSSFACSCHFVVFAWINVRDPYFRIRPLAFYISVFRISLLYPPSVADALVGSNSSRLAFPSFNSLPQHTTYLYLPSYGYLI